MSAAFFTPETLAEYYGIPVTTIWLYCRQNKFPGAMKIGKSYRIPHKAREEFERRHLVNAKTT